MSKNTKKIEKAIELIKEAKELVDSVMQGDLKDFTMSSNYYAYGEYGLRDAMGLTAIITKLEEEGL